MKRRKPYLNPKRYARFYYMNVTRLERIIARPSAPDDERQAARDQLAIGLRKIAAYKKHTGKGKE